MRKSQIPCFREAMTSQYEFGSKFEFMKAGRGEEIFHVPLVCVLSNLVGFQPEKDGKASVPNNFRASRRVGQQLHPVHWGLCWESSCGEGVRNLNDHRGESGKVENRV